MPHKPAATAPGGASAAQGTGTAVGVGTARGSGSRIVGVTIGAAHDGVAELVLQLRHDNGASEIVVLDEATAARVLQRSGIDDPNELVGLSWRTLLTGP